MLGPKVLRRPALGEPSKDIWNPRPHDKMGVSQDSSRRAGLSTPPDRIVTHQHASVPRSQLVRVVPSSGTLSGLPLAGRRRSGRQHLGFPEGDRRDVTGRNDGGCSVRREFDQTDGSVMTTTTTYRYNPG